MANYPDNDRRFEGSILLSKRLLKEMKCLIDCDFDDDSSDSNINDLEALASFSLIR
jgi:hypothetical protein